MGTTFGDECQIFYFCEGHKNINKNFIYLLEVYYKVIETKFEVVFLNLHPLYCGEMVQ